eukprot:3208094-Pyramimonas_sp.AAC.1
MQAAPRSTLASLKNCDASALQKANERILQPQLVQTCAYWATRARRETLPRKTFGSSEGCPRAQPGPPERRFANRTARAHLCKN